MPEGPSIVIMKEELSPFIGKKVTAVSGNAKIALERMKNKKITDIKTWGKHLLICFSDFTVRIHLLMFGTYRINESKELAPRLHLQFGRKELNFYTCSIVIIDGPLEEKYDFDRDVMSKTWDPKKAMASLDKMPRGTLVCDALLNQEVFAGVGNIIKNEVLFRIKVHPASKVDKLPLKQKKALIKEAVKYSFEFLKWKKAFVLKQHWLAHTKKICPRCHIPLIKEILGKTKRRAFYCDNCQVLYK